MNVVLSAYQYHTQVGLPEGSLTEGSLPEGISGDIWVRAC